MPNQNLNLSLPQYGVKIVETYNNYKLQSTTTSSTMANLRKRIVQRTGAITQNYRTLKMGAFVPVNSFQFMKEEKTGPYHPFPMVNTVGLWYPDRQVTKTKWTGVSTNFSAGDNLTYLGLTPEEVTQLDNKCANKTLLKIKDQKINLAQVWAERQQTINLVGDTATKIAKSLQALKKGNFIKASEELGLTLSRRQARLRGSTHGRPDSGWISQNWLALQYGWKPLLNDINGALETLVDAEANRQPMRVEANQRVTRSDTKLTKPSSHYENLIERKVEYTVKYVLYFSVDGNFLKSSSQLGLTNPALIAWELLPWSFVVDWFIPIGNYISSWDATLGVSFVDGCKTTFQKCQSSIKTSMYENVGTYSNYTNVGPIWDDWERVDCRRDKLLAFPSSRPPSFKNPLSFDHIANAMALLHQLKLRK